MNQPKANFLDNSENHASNMDVLQSAYPWIVWFLGAAFFFYKYVLQISPSVMSSELMSSFAISGAGLGNLAACFFYVYLIMQIPVGLLLDRWSPRLITGIAIFFSAFGTFLFSHSHSVMAAGISRGIMGFGAAFAAVSCFKLATLWFPPKRFALVAGLSMTAAMLGAVGGEAPLSYLVNALGWREAMTIIACAGFVLMALVWIFIQDKSSSLASSHTIMPTMDVRQFWNQIKTILNNSQTWFLSIYSGLAFAPVSVFGGLWGVSFLKEAHHLTATSAASSMSFIFIGFAIGCPLIGWLSDFIKRRKVLMAIGTTIALLMISIILYVPISSLVLLDACMLSFGIGASCFFLCFSMIREIHPFLFAATVLGFMNSFDSLCEALSEPFIGKLLDLGWTGAMDHGARLFSVHDYHWALMAMPIYLLLSLITLFFVKETFCQQKD